VLYPRGCELELEAFAKGAKRAKVTKVLSGTPTQQTGKTEKGYVWLADLEASTKPPEFDKVIILNKPKTIKKGEKIGYMGQYCTPEKTTNRPMLHWEVFAGDALNIFITKARAHNAKAKKSEKTVLKIPKGTSLISPNEKEADTLIAEGGVVTTLKTQGEYKQLQVLGSSKKVSRSLLGAWSSTNKVYTPKKENYKTLSTLLGITVNKSTRLSLLKQYKDGNRGIFIPAQKSDIVWVEKTSKLTKLNTLKSQVKTTTNAWKKYPEEFTIEILKTSEDMCFNASELKVKKHDEHNNEWFEIGSYDNQMCSVGYINASNLKYHAPAEFICFDGVDAPGGNDASIHKEPDNYWKNLFAPITLESTQHEEGSPVSDFRLDLQPFAKKVFQYMDENHDGTITLSEVRNAQKDPIKQKKIAKLITKHESEWVKSLDRWKYVEKYIPDATRFDWEHEKARIKKLAWWDDVKGKVTGFPSGDAFYFHPAGFVGNLMGGGLITYEMLKIACPKLTDSYINEALPHFNIYAEAYKVNTKYRIAHFLSQVGHESCFKVIEENLRYSAKGMRRQFGCKGGRKNYISATDDCSNGRKRNKLWTLEDNYKFNAKNLASYVYANRMNNGDEASNEGYKYRGRGIIQLTGKYNYSKFTNAHNLKLPNDQQDFVKNPDLIISNIEYGIESGFYYWTDLAKLNSIADKGDSSVLAITKAINGGTTGLAERKENYEKLKKFF
ncbi:hypothetical protein LR004_01290, partial [Candidatus Gracilibacteria bacterium]|nr:hypothetical protein [Candidatus Gracilibacteria bacterium]